MKNKGGFINTIVLFAIFGLISLGISQGVVDKYYLGIVITMGINIILAASLNLTTGFLGELALGHAGFMSVGAYAAALFTLNSGLAPEVAFPVALLVGGLCAAAFGLLIGTPALRLHGDYLAIITLGFGEIIRVIINNLPAITGGARGLRGIPRLTNFPYVYWIVVITLALLFTLIRSRHGRAIVAIREDEVAAEASGIHITFYKVFAFTVAAFFAGVAGGLYAHYVGILDASKFGFARSIEMLVMVVLGGMGSLTGSVLAAGVLTVLPEMLRQFSELRMVIYAVLLIGMMLFRNKGLLGQWEFSIASGIEWVHKKLPKRQAPEERVDILNPPPLLKVKGMGIAFGGLKALTDVEFEIEKGEIVGLIGPNGAGKTTVFNLLTDVYTPGSGSVELMGRSIVGGKTYKITRSGIARTFQNIRLYKGISVIDNVKTALGNQIDYSPAAGMLRIENFHSQEAWAEARARELLAVFQMEHLADADAANLPYGQQRKLEIARALATNPQLLLLDEPAAGMNPIETQELMETIRFIRDKFDVAILLIEHDMSLVMGICERIIVLDYGKIIATGTPEQIQTNPKVIGAYLGQ